MLNNQERKGAFAQCNDSVALLKINARIYIQSSGKRVAHHTVYGCDRGIL